MDDAVEPDRFAFAGDVADGGAVPARSSERALKPAEVALLCIGSSAGMCGALTVPLWVGAIIGAGLLPASVVGGLASAQAFAMGVGIFGVVAFTPRLRLRWVFIALGLLSSGANLIAMLGTFPSLLFGRVISGLAAGALLAIMTRVGASRPNAQRVLALMEIAAVALGSIVYFIAPNITQVFGAPGIFALLVVVGLLTAVSSVLPAPAFDDASAVRQRRPGRATTHWVAAATLAVGWAMVLVAQSSVSTYIVTIGDKLGIHGQVMGAVLSIALPAAALGPVLGHWLGVRLGHYLPIMLGQAALAINLAWLPHASAHPVFQALAVGLNLWVGFGGPYVGALFGRLDKSGRFAGASPAIGMAGATIGSGLGGYIIETRGAQSLGGIAALEIVASMGLILLAARIERNADRGTPE